MRRLLPFLLVLLVLAEDARASCAPPNPREQLKYADAAFDGRFVSQRTSSADNHWQRWLTFRVDRAIKGRLGETVEIYEPGVSTIAFGRFEPGERVGLTMSFEDGAWRSNHCRLHDPEELADAAHPIPRPPGRGRAAYLVAGGFGDATLALLDRRGRTLAFGSGGGRLASVCPGGRRFVMAGRREVHVRRTRDLRLVRTIRLGFTQHAHCMRDTIVRATSSGIFRGGRRIWRGRWAGMAFHGAHAYVTRGHRILRVDLRSGRERPLATLSLTPEHEELRTLAVSPDGRRLAVLAPNWPVREGEPVSQIAVVRTAGGAVRTAEVRDASAYTAVAWAGRDRFAVSTSRMVRRLDSQPPPPPTRFFDARLRPLGELPGWGAGALAADRGGAVVGASGHRVGRATPAGASELGRLPSSWVFGLHRLPGVPVRASRRVPRF